MTIDAYIQARMASTRLPGKMMLEIGGKPIIQHVIDRVRMFKGIRDVVLLIEDKEKDKELITIAIQNKINVVCSFNPIDRFIQACKLYKPDWFLRVCGDSPFMSIELCDKLIEKIDDNFDYVIYANSETWINPADKGLTCEAVTAKTFIERHEKRQEHVTWDLYNLINRRSLFMGSGYINGSYTIDTQEDYNRLKQLYEAGKITW